MEKRTQQKKDFEEIESPKSSSAGTDDRNREDDATGEENIFPLGTAKGIVDPRDLRPETD